MIVLHIIDWVVFILATISVLYVFVFALAAKIREQRVRSCHYDTNIINDPLPYFLIIIPAYKEDRVIRNTVSAALSQVSGDMQGFDVCVIADHMSSLTLSWLRQQPIKLVEATYDNSTKAKALQAAMETYYEPQRHSHIVILDADNIIKNDFLTQLAQYCIKHNPTAIQAHRCAKNTNTPVAMLDAVSEEINNSVFRLGHNALGLSSALIGSGMCFKAEWFAQAVCKIETAGEDKELERLLLLEGHKIKYLAHLDVYDEKVSDNKSFGQQRRRWLAAQFFTLGEMCKSLPTAIRNGRIDFIDKTLQQALIPRSLLIAICTIMLFVSIVLSLCLTQYDGLLKWSILMALLIISLLAAIPNKLYNRDLLRAIITLPSLIIEMFGSLLHVKGASHKYIHTEHIT